MKKHSVLFLCTGNSCRSQMAEALINSQYGDEWKAVSAGNQPAGFVHPMAVQVLSELGIHHQGTSKSVEVFRVNEFDLVRMRRRIARYGWAKGNGFTWDFLTQPKRRAAKQKGSPYSVPFWRR